MVMIIICFVSSMAVCPLRVVKAPPDCEQVFGILIIRKRLAKTYHGHPSQQLNSHCLTRLSSEQSVYTDFITMKGLPFFFFNADKPS